MKTEAEPNTSTWRKHVAFASVCAFTFLTNYAIGGLAPAFYPLSLQFNKTQAETSHLLIYPILVLVSLHYVLPFSGSIC